MIIDTHSHLNFKAYDEDRDEVIKRAQGEGVVSIDVGTKYETSVKAIELAAKNENIFSAVGMHPIHIKTDLMKLRVDENEGGFAPLGEEFDAEKYRQLVIEDRRKAEGLERSRRIVAIGEIGLDYYYKPKGIGRKERFKQLQKEIFSAQLQTAEEFGLPVIVHCRMAFEDVFQILSAHNLKGVIHSFTGTLEDAKKFIDLGFYLGINGIIFKLNLDQVIKEVSLDKILLETDCPYLTPPKAGVERNEPSFVKYVVEKVAELKGISSDEVAEVTTQSAKELFNF